MSAPGSDALRKGWCPGALRPMLSGDGLLVRLRLTGGILPAPLALALADAARTHGSGAFDLSARANLQMRGVTDDSLGPLTDRLAALGVLDEDPAAEAVRNVVASPLAGLDPAARLDVRPVAAALERRLAGDAALHALPGKFGFAVDDGGAFPLGDLSVDVRFEAIGGSRFAIVVGGSAQGPLLGLCEAEAVPEAAARVALAFLALRGPHRRMAPLVATQGVARLAAAAGFTAPAGGEPISRRTPRTVPGELSAGDRPVLAVATAFGRWSADALSALAGLARDHGTGEMRLTPWRCLLVPGVTLAQTREAIAAHDLIASAADPRLAVIACAGAPACSSAQAPTRDLALALAPTARRLAASGVVLHVSGCSKGCARPEASPITLVGHRGSYDLVRNGRAGDASARQGLDRAAVIEAVRSLAAETAGQQAERGRV